MQTFTVPTPYSIILIQTIEVRKTCRTIEISLPHFFGQDAVGHSGLVVPLCGALCCPSPIEPTPGFLKAGHLAFRIHHQPLLILIRIATRVRVGRLAGTSRGLGGTRWCQDSLGFLVGLQRSLPSGTGTNIV